MKPDGGTAGSGWGNLIPTFGADVRFALRTFRKHPGFTATAVLCLALGIGANTAVFSVVNGVLLKPLPYHQPGRLAMCFVQDPQYGRQNIPPAFYLGWKDHCASFEALSAYSFARFTLTGNRGPQLVDGLVTTPSLFSVLEVRPALGRLFLSGEDKPGHAPVALISWGLFQRRYGGDPRIIGETLHVNGIATTLVGVMPRGFDFPRGAQMWMPPGDLVPTWVFAPRRVDPRTNWNPYLWTIGRLKPGVSFQHAQAEAETLAKHLDSDPSDAAQLRISVVPTSAVIVENARTTLLVLFAVAFFVLMIATVNVTNLLLASAARRRGELAVRTALGAGRGRIARQVLTESVLLAVLGGIAGLVLAAWGVRLLKVIGPETLPRLSGVKVDWTVMAYLTGLSLVAGVLSGLVPAFQASRADVNEFLKDGAPALGRASHSRIRGLLVVFEVALALIVTVGAGLLGRSLVGLQTVKLGFNPRHVLMAQAALSKPEYPTSQRITSFCERTLRVLQTRPGIESSCMTSTLPLISGLGVSAFPKKGETPVSVESFPTPSLRLISPDYFRTMGIPLVRGRIFTEADGQGSPPVAIVSETMARKGWPGQDPIGKHVAQVLDTQNGKKLYREVVGVAGDAKNGGIGRTTLPEMYVPYPQCTTSRMEKALRNPVFLVRTKGDPMALAGAVKSAIWSTDADVPVAKIGPLKQAVAGTLDKQRFTALLVGIFALLAVVLAAIGLYGVLSYLTAQRAHEFGIRIAVGAEPRDIIRLTLLQALKPVLIGILLGLVGVFALTRLIAGLLYGIKPLDPLTLAAASLFFLGVALLACLLPALRAARADPMDGLRSS